MKRKAITAADDMPTEYRKISKQNSNYFLNVREGNKQWIIYFAYNCIYQASLIASIKHLKSQGHTGRSLNWHGRAINFRHLAYFSYHGQ